MYAYGNDTAIYGNYIATCNDLFFLKGIVGTARSRGEDTYSVTSETVQAIYKLALTERELHIAR